MMLALPSVVDQQEWGCDNVAFPARGDNQNGTLGER